MDRGRVALHKLVTEAVHTAGGQAAYAQIVDSITSRGIGTKQSVTAAIVMCTVNAPGRVTCHQNERVRLEPDPRYDTLYRVGKGIVELYNPDKHGKWGIIKEGNKYKVQRLELITEGGQVEGAGQAGIMSTEKEHGRDAAKPEKPSQSSEAAATVTRGSRLSSAARDHTPDPSKRTAMATKQGNISLTEHTKAEVDKNATRRPEDTKGEVAQPKTGQAKLDTEEARTHTNSATTQSDQGGVPSVEVSHMATDIGLVAKTPEPTNTRVPPVDTAIGSVPHSRIASLFSFLQRDPAILGLGARRCVRHRSPVFTDFGVIDLLAEDESGTLTVVSEARSSVPDEQVQFFELVRWARKNLANGRPIRGVLVVPDGVDVSAILGLFKNSPDKRIYRLGVHFEPLA